MNSIAVERKKNQLSQVYCTVLVQKVTKMSVFLTPDFDWLGETLRFKCTLTSLTIQWGPGFHMHPIFNVAKSQRFVTF